MLPCIMMVAGEAVVSRYVVGEMWSCRHSMGPHGDCLVLVRKLQLFRVCNIGHTPGVSALDLILVLT